MNATKPVYTTGAVARICHVAPRTVSKWIDKGDIPGSYRIPHSSDRRVPHYALIAFMLKHGMSVDEIDGKLAVLAVGVVGNDLTALGASRVLRVTPVADSFAAGGAVATGGPYRAAIVDVRQLGAEAAGVAVKRLEMVAVSHIAVLVGECGAGASLAPTAFVAPFDPTAPARWLEEIHGGTAGDLVVARELQKVGAA